MTSMPGARQSRPQGISLLWIVLIMIAVFAVFHPVLQGGFIWDDEYNLLQNERFRGFSLENLRWMFTTFYDGNYHPLVWLSFALDHRLWGWNPAGYHLTNLLLHAANAGLVFLFFSLLLEKSMPGDKAEDAGRRIGAAAGALFFALHPLRVETVAWISVRGDVMCGVFLFLSLAAYLKIEDPPGAPLKNRWLWISLALYVASLMCRAWGITLPVVLLVLDVYPLRRIEAAALFRRNGTERARRAFRILAEKALFALPAAVFALLAFGAKHQGMVSVADYGVTGRFLQAAYGLCFYVWKTVFPHGLSPLYPLGTFDPREPLYWACAAVVAAVTAGCLLGARKVPWALTAWVCYVVVISPQLGLVQSGPQLVADRYSYFATLPFAALIAAGVPLLRRRTGRDRPPAWVLAGLAVLFVALGAASFRQTVFWMNPLHFWDRILEVDPGSGIAVNERARFLWEAAGDLPGAERAYRRAVRLQPKNTDAWVNLGLVRLGLGKHDEAAAALETALRLDPDKAEVHNALGLISFERGRRAEAVRAYDRAVALDPDFADAYNNRGLALRRMGRLEAALADFDRAVALDPGRPEGYVNRGAARLALGQHRMAAGDWRQALAVAPPDWPARARVEEALRSLRGDPRNGAESPRR